MAFSLLRPHRMGGRHRRCCPLFKLEANLKLEYIYNLIFKKNPLLVASGRSCCLVKYVLAPGMFFFLLLQTRRY